MTESAFYNSKAKPVPYRAKFELIHVLRHDFAWRRMDNTGQLDVADRLLGQSGNRGHKNSVQLGTLVHLLHSQANHVSDVKVLKRDALFGDVPSRQLL